MDKTLLLAVFLGFVSGIICRSFYDIPSEIFVLGLLLVSIFIFAWVVNRGAAYAFCGIFLCMALLGAYRTDLATQGMADAFKEQIGQRTAYEGKVITDPDIRETTQRVTVAVEGGKILVVAPLYPKVMYGETVRIEGVLVEPEPFDTTGGRTFQYDKFLQKDEIFVLMQRAHISRVHEAEGLDAGMAFLFGLRHSFLSALSYALPEPHSALAGGLIAGGKQGLGTTLLAAFVLSGLVHIVVLSGYNVMIVAEAVLRFFAFLPKRTGAVLALIVIGAFVLAAGAGAASIRAGIMAGLALVARATGRTYAVIRALLVAAFLMLLLNPHLLMLDPGFQLSFVATFGLIVGAPLLSEKLRMIKNTFVKELLASTLAAQIAVLPLLLYQTGVLSLVSLPANLAVLPAVPLAMLLSAVAGVAGLLSTTLAPIFGLPAFAVLSYIIAVTEKTASLPFAGVSLPVFPFWIVLIAYGALGIGAHFLSKKSLIARPC
ncbi:ComEC family competence protein [Patescibacteria group bacterium]|nr:ComEC family competence protein [Patescibacteria group bacterium]MBU1500418.1 ComEC family competence protein [Patescibacteria group bacterium]MBU2080486.1 ComEC family competence protein [Patescibacteria group bacterium]MBU2123709.1 ComEC family competence protein [Patescibacteria group bacterium]MBU2194565.1 ComEC family competence protein [Patescibacteria group bacterium]